MNEAPIDFLSTLTSSGARWLIGALIRCKDILLERKIRVVGLDYDADYVAGAKAAIEKANLQQQVTVVEMSVYDAPQQRAKLLLPGETKPQPFRAVYFSGSFSLLPDSLGALTAVASLLIPKAQGRIFITQTYQRFVPPFMSLVKPLLLYIISIDFGQLMKEDRMTDFFHNEVPKQSNLDCVEHEVIKGSVDNFLQAAYLTILKPRS